MSSGAKLASECFAENLQHYVNRQTDAEKYNHYNGLRALSEEVAALSLSVGTIANTLNSLAQRMDDLSRQVTSLKK
jgi:hypothetical protein